MIGNVDIKTTSGEIRVRNLKGSFEAESVSGDMNVDSFSEAEKIEIETVSADISMAGILTPNGSYTVSSHSGDITFKIPDGSDFELQTRTSTGDMACDFEVKAYGDIDRGRLRGIVGKGGASLDFSTFSGDIRVKQALNKNQKTVHLSGKTLNILNSYPFGCGQGSLYPARHL